METVEQKIICHCRHVSEQDIINAVNKGVKTFTELQKMTSASGGCKGCFSKVMDFFQRLLREKRNKRYR